ncbi:MAG: hypothetical protein A2705_03085 [Omnitrophica WOR_2 bacterium RIFCSPHIGHO2_01_FULL_52_10]|nr:MAG: hypothetical protein A2705_03085 [Omnitrophica WOR_2 bacterium RIFCSPHIGHO2_01_FULL_52_10]
MNRFKKTVLILLLCAVCTASSGCALLKVPLALMKLPFTIAWEALKFAQKLPKPPPGVFF